jgi:hypothetical protein
MFKGSQTATGTPDDDGGTGTNRNHTTTSTIKLVYPVTDNGKAEESSHIGSISSSSGEVRNTVASSAHPKQARKLRSAPAPVPSRIRASTGGSASEKVGRGGFLPMPMAIENVGSPDDHLYLLMLQPAQMELLEDLLTDLATRYQGVPERKKLFKDLQMLLQAVKQASADGMPPSAAQAEVCFQLFQSESKPSPKQL